MDTILRVPYTQFCGVPLEPERRRLARDESDDSAIKRKPTVLVVDDEHLIADTLAEILSDKGFDASAVYNPRHAIEQITELCPDIVITDVIMPGMNGIELAKLIRNGCSGYENHAAIRPSGDRRAGRESQKRGLFL